VASGVDIKLLGDKALQRKLDALGRKAKPVFNRASRPSAKRLRERISEAAPVDTGNLKKAMRSAKIRVLQKAPGVGIELPTREALGIDAKAKGYYPLHVEYGYIKNGKQYPARSYIRRTVDAMGEEELKKLTAELAEQIEKEALKQK